MDAVITFCPAHVTLQRRDMVFIRLAPSSVPIPHACWKRQGRGAQIIALGVAYFVAVTALDVVTNVGAIDDLTSTARIVLVPPPARGCFLDSSGYPTLPTARSPSALPCSAREGPPARRCAACAPCRRRCRARLSAGEAALQSCPCRGARLQRQINACSWAGRERALRVRMRPLACPSHT